MDLNLAYLIHRLDIIHRMRKRDHWRQFIYLDLYLLLKLSVFVRLYLLKSVFSPVLFEVRLSGLVGRKYAGLGPGLDHHIRDDKPLRHRKILHRLTGKLKSPISGALGAK